MESQGFYVALGTLLGGAIAFLSTYGMGWLGRQRRRRNSAKLLCSEIFSNKKILENAVSKVDEVEEEGKVVRWAAAPFSRTILGNSVDGLALFDSTTLDAVLKSYARLDHVEWAVRESYFQEGRWAVDKMPPPRVQKLMAGLQQEFRNSVQGALESANDALSNLERLSDWKPPPGSGA